jgi:hypothetical protein
MRTEDTTAKRPKIQVSLEVVMFATLSLRTPTHKYAIFSEKHERQRQYFFGTDHL